MNFENMKHGLVLKIQSIESFEEKLAKSSEDNWKIKGIIRDVGNGNFENLPEREQEMIVDFIINNQ